MMYMNTMTGEIIDEESFDELVDEEMEMWLDEYNFERWIDERYNAHEIFSMCEMERQEVMKSFTMPCAKRLLRIWTMNQ